MLVFFILSKNLLRSRDTSVLVFTCFPLLAVGEKYKKTQVHLASLPNMGR